MSSTLTFSGVVEGFQANEIGKIVVVKWNFPRVYALGEETEISEIVR